MGRHTDPEQPDTPDPADLPTTLSAGDRPSRAGQRVERWVLAPTCLIVALALLVDQPGPSPAMAFLRLVAPLPVWATLFGVATVLLAVRLAEAGHVAAFVGWVAVAAGAVSGLVLGSTSSPTASLIFAALTVAITGLHLTGFVLRQVQRARARTG